jgi:hypothetical protein
LNAFQWGIVVSALYYAHTPPERDAYVAGLRKDIERQLSPQFARDL